MFTFYKVDVDSPYDWKAIFMKDDEMTTIKNDKGALERLLSQTNFLVGYDNYQFDDKLLASILKGIDPFETLMKIKGKKRITFNLQNPITIDLKQELSTELDEIKLNLGYGSTHDNLEVMKEIFKLRENYLMSKFEVV